MKAPKTPFSTRLSGNAKETELRLRSIFQWQKKRPPMLLFILALLVAVGCGGLVSCQSSPGDEMRSDIQETTVTINNHGAWTIEEPKKELSGIGRNWLADLPVAELPKEAAELRDLTRYDMWRDMLIPLAYDEGADVTVYGVISNEFQDEKNEIPLDLYDLESDGIVIRCGNKAAYHPLYWGDHLWLAENPELYVGDFDGDGEEEAGVIFLVGHGTGCNVRQLYIFELDTLTYSVPDCSTLDIRVTYDPNTRQAVLNSGEESVTVEVPEGVPEFEGAYIGNIIDFTYEDGQFYFSAGLDFYRALAYLATAKAPVVYEDGQYCLGEISSLTGIE